MMKTHLFLVFYSFLSVGVFAAAEAVHESAPVRKSDAVPEKLCTGFRFTEGPASDGKGGVYFTDIPNARIHHWNAERGCVVWRESSGEANGLWVLEDGRVVACEHKNRRVSLLSSEGEHLTTIVDSYDGKRLNSPNDVWPDTHGGYYFTDPRYGKKDDLEQDGFHVYYVSKQGQISRVIQTMKMPNGIMGDLARNRLYVADHGDGNVWVYTLGEPGKISDGRIFYSAASDGMTLDERGNLYLTTKVVEVINPDGRLIDRIEFPEQPANVAFGGAEGRELFVTARTSLYRLPMLVKGAPGTGRGF